MWLWRTKRHLCKGVSVKKKMSNVGALLTLIKEVERAKGARCLEFDEEHVPVNRAPAVQCRKDDIFRLQVQCVQRIKATKKMILISLSLVFALLGNHDLFTVTKLGTRTSPGHVFGSKYLVILY